MEDGMRTLRRGMREKTIEERASESELRHPKAQVLNLRYWEISLRVWSELGRVASVSFLTSAQGSAALSTPIEGRVFAP